MGPDDVAAAAVEAARVRLEALKWGLLNAQDGPADIDPLAAIVEHLAAVVVLAEAADMGDGYRGLTFDELFEHVTCRAIAATKEAE